MLTWIEGSSRRGTARHGHEVIFFDIIVNVDTVAALVPHRRFPTVFVATGCLVIVAKEQPRFIGQRQ